MKLFYIGELIFVYITAVVCLLRLPSDSEVYFQDDVYIRLKEGARTRRSADDEQLHPETYDFDLSVNSTRLHVHLKRNDNLKTSVPTLAIKGGFINEKTFQDNEESIFYQDIKNGAVFVVQEDENRAKHLFGVFQAGGENYVVQTPGRNKTIKFGSNYNRFQIFKEKHTNITFNDSLRKRLMKTKIRRGVHDRRKRAAGPYQVELLIVVDYSVYQYWYNKSTKTTALERETDALSTVRQFYAFVINGMDAMYKNIQTTAYTISIVFAGIIIAQTSSDSSFTETIVVKSVEPNQVDASAGLANFKTWEQSQTNLPGHDHAMLFTRYDLTSGGLTGIAAILQLCHGVYCYWRRKPEYRVKTHDLCQENGQSFLNNVIVEYTLHIKGRKLATRLAYLSAACTSFRQSIVEDHFNFILLTIASHELGHSLSSDHDGVGNTCSFSDAFIMASSSSPQTGSTATNSWKFSSCSTNYFTKYIDSLESSGSNCLKSLSSTYNASALAQYTDKPGQVYDANAQCVNIQGPGSFFCSNFYNGNLSTICTLMWCANPSKPGFCSSAVAADGTLCGDQKWCVTGVCVNYVTSSTTSMPTVATTTIKATPTQTTTPAASTTLPTTTKPTITSPSTTKQTTTPPTTTIATTTTPTTTKVTTTPPTTTKPTTTPPTTTKQTTTPPTTTKPTTTPPTTTKPTTTPSTTTKPTTTPPTTTKPTTTPPTTTKQTTTPPTTTKPTTTPPTTTKPTPTPPTTTKPTTTTLTTIKPTTTTPTTTKPTTTPSTTRPTTTTPPTTTRPTTTPPTTTKPTTTPPTTTKPTTTTLTTIKPTTTPPTTTKPTTTPSTTRPTTPTPPTTTRPTSTPPTTTKPTTTPRTTTNPTTTPPTTTRPTTTPPFTTKPTTTTLTTTKSTTTPPTTTKPTTTLPSTTKPSTTKPTTIKPTNATITQTTTKKRSTTKRRRPRNRKRTTKQTATRTSTTTSP